MEKTNKFWEVSDEDVSAISEVFELLAKWQKNMDFDSDLTQKITKPESD